MWCFTAEEAEAWCAGSGVAVEARRPVHKVSGQSLSVPLTSLSWSQLAWLGRFSSSLLEPFDECLLWVTLSGVWPSSENWHLFYRLRETYWERRLLRSAPAHLFLKHESTDLATFVGLALQFGWDCHLLPVPTYTSAFISHDEFMDLHPRNEQVRESLKQSLASVKLTFTTVGESSGTASMPAE